MVKQTQQTILTKKQLEEKITNRVLINLVAGFGGYVLLYLVYRFLIRDIRFIKAYPYVMLGFFIVFAALAALFYVLSYKGRKSSKNKVEYKNYGHMFVGVSLCTLFLNLPHISLWLGIAKFVPDALKNTQRNFLVISILLAVYLVGMLIYNSVFLYRKPKKASK